LDFTFDMLPSPFLFTKPNARTSSPECVHLVTEIRSNPEFSTMNHAGTRHLQR